MKIPFFGKSEPEIDVDPVCKMEVHKSNPPGGTARQNNVTYYFCTAACRHEFEQDPQKYLSASTA